MFKKVDFKTVINKILNLENKLNYFVERKIPFFFLIDYNQVKYDIQPLDHLPSNIKYQISNTTKMIHNCQLNILKPNFKEYKTKFNKILRNIKNGNCYLANLTAITTIKNSIDLYKIYENANANFKLYYKGEFVCFSPERFIKIENNKIYAYPMKGTIDADLVDAKNILLNDKKELAEHTMIVDLLRNDLSIVSKNVTVEKFRYIDTIQAGDKKLLQTSSIISGQLSADWKNNITNILLSILPVGSITGTPKKKTVELLEKIEGYDRGYFTGIFGVFDGTILDSSVIIRYIEKKDNKFIYKSGGGITIDSIVEKEYEEMCDKVYIP